MMMGVKMLVNMGLAMVFGAIAISAYRRAVSDDLPHGRAATARWVLIFSALATIFHLLLIVSA